MVSKPGSEIALSWSPVHLKILQWQQKFYNWSLAGNKIFQATIVRQTIHVTLILSQINSNKVQSCSPIGHFLFNFLLLMKYKTDFPVVINLPQHFAATISGKLCRHVFSGVSHNVHIAGFKRLVVAWCEQHGNPSIVLTECERKDHFKHIGKSSFSVGYISSPKGRDRRRYKVDLKHLAVSRNCIYGRHSIRLLWFFSDISRCINNQDVRI